MSFYRNPWIAEVRPPSEDQLIQILVEELGVSKWGRIASIFKSNYEGFKKTGK